MGNILNSIVSSSSSSQAVEYIVENKISRYVHYLKYNSGYCEMTIPYELHPREWKGNGPVYYCYSDTISLPLEFSKIYSFQATVCNAPYYSWAAGDAIKLYGTIKSEITTSSVSLIVFQYGSNDPDNILPVKISIHITGICK